MLDLFFDHVWGNSCVFFLLNVGMIVRDGMLRFVQLKMQMFVQSVGIAVLWSFFMVVLPGDCAPGLLNIAGWKTDHE